MRLVSNNSRLSELCFNKHPLKYINNYHYNLLVFKNNTTIFIGDNTDKTIAQRLMTFIEGIINTSKL
jgi:hypothetical protein